MTAVVSDKLKFQQIEDLFGDLGQQYVIKNDNGGANNTITDSAGATVDVFTVDSANAYLSTDSGGKGLNAPFLVKKYNYNRYYIGIGRSQDWNATDSASNPRLSARDFRLASYDIQSVKLVNDYKFVVPRNNWIVGATYSGYDDNTVGYPTYAYYVLTDENNVYFCLQQAKNASGTAQASTIKPTGGTNGNPFKTADNYVWKFLYNIDATNANKYLAANFIPVEKVIADSDGEPTLTASQVQQYNIQQSAVAGSIINVQLDSGGAGYGSTPKVKIVGNGGSAVYKAVISGGVVRKVECAFDSAGENGSGFTYASIEFDDSSGTVTKPAKARAVIGPAGGIGADPRLDLKCKSLMFNVQPEGNEAGKWLSGNDFRQVMLIKNILSSGYDSSNAVYTAEDGNALKRLGVGISTAFARDDIILGGTSGAKAYIDSAPEGTGYGTLRFHQNEITGFRSFTIGESLSVVGGSGVGTVSTVGDSAAIRDVDNLTGDILYVDNRAAVTRANSQTEDLKIVITI